MLPSEMHDVEYSISRGESIICGTTRRHCGVAGVDGYFWDVRH